MISKVGVLNQSVNGKKNTFILCKTFNSTKYRRDLRFFYESSFPFVRPTSLIIKRTAFFSLYRWDLALILYRNFVKWQTSSTSIPISRFPDDRNKVLLNDGCLLNKNFNTLLLNREPGISGERGIKRKILFE